MALGIAEIILLGLLVDWLFRKMRLPGLIGLLFLGVLLGPWVLNGITPGLQQVASEWQMIALIVILLRAGFEISRQTLAKVGMRAALIAFIPCLFEIAAVTLLAPSLLNLSVMEAALLGSVLAAVSPAVVVPLMIRFIEERRGADKGVPTLILAGASIDDAVAITLCTSFLGLYTGQSVNLTFDLLSIPFSIVTGITAGALLGWLLYRFFSQFDPRATKRVMILLGIAVLLLHLEKMLKGVVPFAALLAIMTVGFIILEKKEVFAHEISAKLGKIWIFAQILLFVIVGTKVNLPVALDAGLSGALLIAAGLTGRSLGVLLCLTGSGLNRRERLFAVISYLPKATVQAAIGALPLAVMQTNGMDTAPGELILALAVLAILLTAPLGALLISKLGPKLLSRPDHNTPESCAAAPAKE